MPKKPNNRFEVLGQVRNPLLFFALALLVIEGIIGLVVAKSQMTGTQQFCSVIVMAVLFLAVLIAVTLITIKWPRHLYEDLAKDIQLSKEVKRFIESRGFRDSVEQIVVDMNERNKPTQS